MQLSEAISPILEHALRRAQRMYTAASLDMSVASSVYMPMVSHSGLLSSLQACYAPYIDRRSTVGHDLASLITGVHSDIERLETAGERLSGVEIISLCFENYHSK